MKTKRVWVFIIIFAVIAVAVLAVPIPKAALDDGGTREYAAMTYRIVKWKKFYAGGTYEKTKVYFGKDLKNVLLLTVKIIVPDAARLQRRHDGGVHAQNKGFGHALNPRNIQRVRSDDPLLPAAPGQTPGQAPGQQADGQPCKHPFRGSYLPCISRRKPLPDCAFIFRIGRRLPVRDSGILPPVQAGLSHGSVRRWCR